MRNILLNGMSSLPSPAPSVPSGFPSPARAGEGGVKADRPPTEGEGRGRNFTALACVALVFLTACHKSPADRTHDAAGGPVGNIVASANLKIFSSELTTGGGAFEYPSGNDQVLAFNDQSNPISQRSIRYFWNGQIADASQDCSASPCTVAFVGFDLMHTTSLGTYAATPGRNLAYAGYHKMTFYARGSLSANTVVKIEAADDGNQSTPDACMTLSANGTDDVCSNGNTAQLSAGWQHYSLNVSAASFNAVKDFFKATYVYTYPIQGLPGQAAGGGGTVYFDQIQYEP